MNNRILHLVLLTSLTMWACSDENSTSGISIEPNATAEISSSSEGVPSSSSFSDSTNTNAQAFIDSTLNAFSLIQHSNDNNNDPSEVPVPVTDYGLSSKKEIFYSYSSKNGLCTVFIDRDDMAVQKFKDIKPGINVTKETKLIRKHEDNLFIVDLLYASFSNFSGSSENLICKTENESYLSQCQNDDCHVKILDSDCNSTQIVFVKEISATTTLDEIASLWKSECEDYASTLPEEEKTPGESCRMEENGETVCGPTSK